MVTAMLVAAVHAGALASAAAADARAISHPPPFVADLPMAAVAAWPMRRCGEGIARADEPTATDAIDAACVRLVVRDRAGYRANVGRWSRGGGGGDAGGDGGAGWRVAEAVLPGLGGLMGPGGMGLGVGSELQLVRGAHMTLHLAAPRDTRIAASTFAPETTVHARCGACWDEGEALGIGLNGDRRARSAVR